MSLVGAGAAGASPRPNANTAGPPTTTHAVQPTYHAGNITTCPSGTTTFVDTSDAPTGAASAMYSEGGTVFTTTVDATGTYLSFSTNSPSFTVYVKGGPAWDTYDYTVTAYPSDTGLHAPYNNGGNIAGISHYLVCGQPFTGGKATPTLKTTPGAGGAVGTAVLNDSATLSGGTVPTGSITFDLYGPSDPTCTGTPAYTQTVTLTGTGTGTYSTSNATPADAVGTWRWTAAYGGDTHNDAASSGCGTETVAVSKAVPRLSTTPSAGGTVTVVVLNDTATLSGGYHPTGSITFDLYGPSDPTCTGTPAYTQTVTLTGTGTGSYSTTNTTPAGAQGTWSWTASYGGDGNNLGASSGCTKETVTVGAVPQGSCEGSGSVASLVSGTNVLAYAPKGSWDSSATGIDVVNVEGSSITDTTIPTGSDVINSCASDSVTGVTVCTANNADVWILKGAGLDPTFASPLVDAATTFLGFSGGTAMTTGVSMDATDNEALVAIGLSSGTGPVGAFQLLNLATGTFSAPIETMSPGGQISEDPLIDPVHHLILSAAENNTYELITVQHPTAPQYFEHAVTITGILDSSAEDCSTGIVMAPAEGAVPSQLFLADIQNAGSAPRAVFTPGTPGTWTAPSQVQTLTGSDLSAGASGSAVAQGTHVGVVAGEFGGNGLTALALPTTSGSGVTPSVGNWVSCSVATFSMGLDPHTLAAYQSPNGGDAIAIMVNTGATELVRVDLTKMLDSSIVPATGHVCTGTTLPATVVTRVTLP